MTTRDFIAGFVIPEAGACAGLAGCCWVLSTTDHLRAGPPAQGYIRVPGTATTRVLATCVSRGPPSKPVLYRSPGPVVNQVVVVGG